MRRPNAHTPLSYIRSTLCLWIGLGFLTLLCLVWTPFALLLLTLPRSVKHQRVGRSIIRNGFCLYLQALRTLGWLDLKLEALDQLESAPPSIIAPNHPGLLDAVILLAVLPNSTCILKASLLKHPLFGPGARLAGYIPNDRTHDMIRRAVKALNQGQHVLMFPEGTRTYQTPISPLKVSPFLIAWKARAPIRTVLIQNQCAFLGKKVPFYLPPKLPVAMSVQPGKIFMPIKNVRVMAKEVEDYFHTAL